MQKIINIVGYLIISIVLGSFFVGPLIVELLPFLNPISVLNVKILGIAAMLLFGIPAIFTGKSREEVDNGRTPEEKAKAQLAINVARGVVWLLALFYPFSQIIKYGDIFGVAALSYVLLIPLAIAFDLAIHRAIERKSIVAGSVAVLVTLIIVGIYISGLI